MYVPSEVILKKYADILIKFALHDGQGVQPGEVVLLSVPELAKPLLWQLQKSVLESGAHYITMFSPAGDDRRTMGNRQFYELANEQQLTFFPDKYLKGLIEQVDHQVAIIAEDDPHSLDGIPSKKIITRQQSMKPYLDWRNAKEYSGKLTWTLALYGTELMAKEANLALESYWEQIITACFLEDEDPIASWKKVTGEIERIRQTLTDLQINKLHVEAKDTDLWITMGPQRRWKGGSGRNIPSFEVFTSPDARYTEGHIRFNQPLYLYGQKAENIYLEFGKGQVTKVSADKGVDILEEMLKAPNADRIGEFSLTDGRMSHITKFMANTLYDENVGGKQGNTHLALGMSYKDTYDGDPKSVNPEQWSEMGFNDSAVHTDIMSTSQRKVTAILYDDTEKVIYKNGKFTV